MIVLCSALDGKCITLTHPESSGNTMEEGAERLLDEMLSLGHDCSTPKPTAAMITFTRPANGEPANIPSWVREGHTRPHGEGMASGG